jgi:hypothetical protein
VLLITNSLYNRALRALIQAIQFLHIVLIQFETVHISIALDSGRRVALGERHESLLQTPAYEDLVGRHFVLIRDADESLVLSLFVADKWAVGFDDDVVGLAVFDAFALLAPWMELSGVSGTAPEGYRNARRTSI